MPVGVPAPVVAVGLSTSNPRPEGFIRKHQDQTECAHRYCGFSAPIPHVGSCAIIQNLGCLRCHAEHQRQLDFEDVQGLSRSEWVN
jgi:hypothetical protein